ncbi:MAG TPA: hypothetical protein VNT56_09120 [Acidimicrobiales bacterium]|nr:hypothetical protein [Acidimicrobiales bacterium]
MDEVIEFDLIDLAGVELGEAVADVLKECSELLLVVGIENRARLAPLRLSLEAPGT